MGIDASSLVIDIKTLLTVFKNKEDSSFSAFREAWISLEFTDIHRSIHLSESREKFTNMLFSAALSLFRPCQSLWVRIGILYTLYLLFHTQEELPCVGIPISVTVWEKYMKPLHQQLVVHSMLDALSIFHLMISKGCFDFCPFVPDDLQVTKEGETRMSQLWMHSIEPDRLATVRETLPNLDKRAKEYEQARTELLADGKSSLGEEEYGYMLYHQSGLLRQRDFKTCIEYPFEMYEKRDQDSQTGESDEGNGEMTSPGFGVGVSENSHGDISDSTLREMLQAAENTKSLF